MERRSFLSAVVAWVVALFALVLPRRGAARALSGFTPPTGPASPSPLPYRDGEYRQDARVYRDAGQMLDEMHAHLCLTGHSVVVADEPQYRRVGFATFDATPGAPEAVTAWQAGIPGVKALQARLQEHGESGLPRSFGSGSLGEDAVALLLECLTSSEGRLRLARAYESAGRARFRAKLGPFT
jgi:hypothetical protein